jgi:hypothetical protein
MVKRLFLLCAIACVPGPARAQGEPAHDLPVEPIRPAAHGVWPDALELSNDVLRVVVEPASGRIVDLAWGSGGNLLKTDGAEGGEGLRIEDGQGGMVWTAHAWLGADGVRHARVRGLADPAGEALCTRDFALDDQTRTLLLRHEVPGSVEKGTAPLFHALRVASPVRIVLPVDPGSAFEEGYALLAGGGGERVLTRCQDAVVLDGAVGGRYAIGTDSTQGWLAAEVPAGLLLVQVTEGRIPPLFGGKRCGVRVINDPPGGYAELHTAGPDPACNVLEIALHDLPRGLSPCELAAAAGRLAEPAR